jgi:5-methylcytosine-specific restriction endonuclease McrA
MKTKLCSKCKKEKSIKEFWHDKRARSGLKSSCIECDKKYPHKEYCRKKCEKYGIGLGTLQRYGLKTGLAVYDKFKRKCSRCGEINDLTIHHLDRNGRNNQEKGLPINNEIDNLILICRRCHGSIHGKEGKGIPKKKK